MPFALCLCSIILPEQSYPLCVLGPKATDCIRGSRDREGFLSWNWIAITFRAHIKETWLLSNSLFLFRGFRALGLGLKRQHMYRLHSNGWIMKTPTFLMCTIVYNVLSCTNILLKCKTKKREWAVRTEALDHSYKHGGHGLVLGWVGGRLFTASHDRLFAEREEVRWRERDEGHYVIQWSRGRTMGVWRDSGMESSGWFIYSWHGWGSCRSV